MSQFVSLGYTYGSAYNTPVKVEDGYIYKISSIRAFIYATPQNTNTYCSFSVGNFDTKLYMTWGYPIIPNAAFAYTDTMYFDNLWVQDAMSLDLVTSDNLMFFISVEYEKYDKYYRIRQV